MNERHPKPGGFEKIEPTTGELTMPGGPSPLAARSLSAFKLVMLSGPTPGRTIVIEGTTTVGRGPEADIVIDAPYISRRHARLVLRGPRDLALEDLASRNGTLLNGQPVKGEARLHLGDRVQFGAGTVLLLSPHDPAEDQLRQAQKLQLLGQMAGGIAHDINNLAGAALANLDFLLVATDVGRDEQQDCLRESQAALRRMVEMVRRLLAFARRRPAKRELVELEPIVSESMALVRHHGGPRVRIHCDVPRTLRLRGDSTQLLQVFLNLGINAVDAMPDGGDLRVVVDAVGAADQERIRIRVSDTGQGMDDAVQSRLFEPFFTTKGVGKGTGLGLATVYAVVQEHDGIIEVESAPGEGTTVTVLLPASEPTERPSRRTDRWASEPQLNESRRTVLVVDDEALLAQSTARLLRVLGFEPVCAGTGDEALAMYPTLKNRLWAVLLDVSMPGKNGIQVLRELQDIDAHAPVILTSGSTDLDDLQRRLGACCPPFVSKPYELGMLRTALVALHAEPRPAPAR